MVSRTNRSLRCWPCSAKALVLASFLSSLVWDVWVGFVRGRTWPIVTAISRRYHKQLCHLGQTRTELTVCQHFIWDGLSTTVKKICSACHTCQLTKRQKVKYGHLLAKGAKVKPWETLCVDLIGPYQFKQPNNQKRHYMR